MCKDMLFTAESHTNGKWSNPLRNARGRSRWEMAVRGEVSEMQGKL